VWAKKLFTYDECAKKCPTHAEHAIKNCWHMLSTYALKTIIFENFTTYKKPKEEKNF
jgi:hypothetical protein